MSVSALGDIVGRTVTGCSIGTVVSITEIWWYVTVLPTISPKALTLIFSLLIGTDITVTTWIYQALINFITLRLIHLCSTTCDRNEVWHTIYSIGYSRVTCLAKHVRCYIAS